ncbi:MAG: amidohydrolase family protein, partial [Sphingobium sp.]
LQKRRHDIDYAVQLPHSALRMFVMGARALDRELSQPAERDQMRTLTREAIEAGAIGFGTSRSVFHRSPDGQIIPTAHAEIEELTAIAEGIRDAGGGVVQAILDVHEPVDDLKLMSGIMEKVGLPFSFSLFQGQFDPENWRELLRLTEAANENGAAVHAQAFPRPVGMLLGLDVSFNPFSACPAYQAIAHLPLAERVAQMRRPEVRAAILADKPSPQGLPAYEFARRYEVIYPMGDPPCYEPDPSTSLSAQAAARGVKPKELAYDMLLEDDGHAMLIAALANYEYSTLDPIREMITHRFAVPALGDGGAHYGMICDSTYTTFMLTYWARDRASGRIAMQDIVASLTGRPAAMLGLHDRGLIAPGLRANINVIDADRLALRRPRVIHDLPAGGRRIVQDADGYVATIVGGEIIMRDGAPTGALPGRMARRTGPKVAMAAE